MGRVGKFLLERGKGLIYNRGRVLLFVTYFDFFLYCVNIYGNEEDAHKQVFLSLPLHLGTAFRYFSY